MKIEVKLSAGKKFIIEESDEELKVTVENKVANPSVNGTEVVIHTDKKVVMEEIEKTVMDKATNTESEKRARKIPKYTANDTMSNADEFEIFVKELCGRITTYVVKPSDISLSLKEKIQEKKGFTLDEQRLVFSGKQFEDDRILSSYNVIQDCTIYLVLLHEVMGTPRRV